MCAEGEVQSERVASIRVKCASVYENEFRGEAGGGDEDHVIAGKDGRGWMGGKVRAALGRRAAGSSGRRVISAAHAI